MNLVTRRANLVTQFGNGANLVTRVMAMGDYEDPYEGLPRRSLFTSVVDASKPSRVLGYDLPACRALPEPKSQVVADAETKAPGRGKAKGRGRPAKSNAGALTAAEKQAAYRARKKTKRGEV